MWKKHMHRKNIERKFLKIAVGLSVWGIADSIIHGWNSIIMVTILCIDFWSPELIIIFPMCFNTIGWTLTVIYTLFRQTKIHTLLYIYQAHTLCPALGTQRWDIDSSLKNLQRKRNIKVYPIYSIILVKDGGKVNKRKSMVNILIKSIQAALEAQMTATNFFSLIWGESPEFWHVSKNGFDFTPAKLRLGLPWWLNSKESIC